MTVNHWVVGSNPTLGAMLIDPELRKLNPVIGKRIMLVNCTDEFTLLKHGDLGTITFVDDTGTVFVNWDSGSKLGLIPGLDQWRIIHE